MKTPFRSGYRNLKFLSLALVAAPFFLSPAVGQQNPDAAWKGKISKSAKDSQPYKVEYVKKAAANSPNIVWIILDDVGYGATSAFGGLIQTPHLDSLANQGLRYTNFHTA